MMSDLSASEIAWAAAWMALVGPKGTDQHLPLSTFYEDDLVTEVSISQDGVNHSLQMIFVEISSLIA